MTDSVVVEGYVKFRDGKKWKTRWVVLRKPSPVADCLVLLVFKDKSDKAQGHRERASVTLEDICGLETAQWLEGVGYSLAILCLSQATVLGFDCKEALLAWDVRIRYSLGEVHRFNVAVLPGTKLECGPATLHLCNNLLALARDVPPVIVGHWNLPDLRRYGPVPNGFVFEGGTRCGYWAGVFFLACVESEHISFLFDCVVRGISPSRGPFGLRPVLPDPNVSQASSEERLNQEAQELEKRLSRLSHQSSTASSTYVSVASDDRSISGSSDASDTSQSDCSIGSRLAMWAEPPPGTAPSDNIGQSGAKVALQSAEKLSVSHGGGAPRPVAKPPRQLQEIGRQSSSDSGIATGSHSSYSGSFSSYAGSLDLAPGEEYGSVFSLPPHLAQNLSPCTCVPPALGHEYQVPMSVRYLYDIPRSLLQEEGGVAKGGGGGARESGPPTPTDEDNPGLSTPSSGPSEGDKRGPGGASGGQADSADKHSAAELSRGCSEEGKKSKVAPPSDSQQSCQSCHNNSPASKTIFTICSVCGGFKGTPSSQAGSLMPTVPDKRLSNKDERRKVDPAYEIMESRALEKNSETEEKVKYELMGGCGHQRSLQEAEGPVFVFPPEGCERPRGDGVTYVNIPISPVSKKQLNYMELELQESCGSGLRGTAAHLPVQRRGSTKYVQIDITATETAHKVGTQHALGREEGLHTLEQRRRRGVPQ